jgi:circadian clock protein KaiC
MFTALTLNNIINDQTDEGVSSLVDAWLSVRDIESNGERNRGLYIMKSRGMKHSNQVREFIITNQGLNLIDVYVGPDGILTGSAREYQKLLSETEDVLFKNNLDRKKKEIQRKAKELESAINSLKSEYESIKEQLENDFVEQELKKEVKESTLKRIIQLRESKSTDNVGIKKPIK